MTQESLFRDRDRSIQERLWTTEFDIERRKDHTTVLGHALMIYATNGRWVAREELEKETNTKNFTARISELRAKGFIIENSRSGGTSYYRLVGIQETSTTRGGHCPTCRCGKATT